MNRTPGTHARRPAPVLARRALETAAVALSVSALFATASTARADEAPAASTAPVKNHDPLERVNRATYAFNDALDRMLARPAAQAYRHVVPQPVRTALSNVLANFEYPETLVNSALQGKLKDAGQDAARFVVNSTIGIGGLWDPATKFGIPRHDEDFGQTLGRWGVPAGPYLVLPVLGPASLRDGPSRFVDRYANAQRYIGAGYTEYYIQAVILLDKRAELLATSAALDTAFDPYALVRNAYLQRREYLVKDGQVAEDDYETPFEEPTDDTAPSGDAAAPATTTEASPASVGAPTDSSPPADPAPKDDAAHGTP